MVNPLGSAFDFGEVADGGAVEHNVSSAVGPLGAIFFVSESGAVSESGEDGVHFITVSDGGLVFDARLVPCGSSLGFMGEPPAIAVNAEAQDFSGVSEVGGGGVVEGVGFKGGWRFLVEASALQRTCKRGGVVDDELNLDFVAVVVGHRLMAFESRSR